MEGLTSKFLRLHTASVPMTRRAPKLRGAVIAVAVALMVLAAPSLVAASAGGREHAGRASSPRGGAVTHGGVVVAPNGDLVLEYPYTQLDLDEYEARFAKHNRDKLIKSLKAGAKSLAGGIAQAGAFAVIGWVLDQWGGGGGIEGQIAEIRTQLNEIQNTLNKIDDRTAKLRTELADSTFANLVHQAAPIVAHVNTGMKDLNFIAHLPADDPTKKGLTEHLLTFIHNDLLNGKQLELADRISGTVGAHGLIAAAYKVALEHHRIWSLRTSLQVREVVEYYQLAEARLLTLRVEYMHAHPEAYSPAYIETQTSDVDAMLHKQDNELKPMPKANVVADTRTDHEWLDAGLSYGYTFYDAKKFAEDVGSTGIVSVLTGWTKTESGPFTFPTPVFRSVDVGNGWRLPQWPEVKDFIAGWADPSGSWIKWLNREAGGLEEGSLANYPVWTATTLGSYVIGVDTSGKETFDVPFGSATRSPFLVRTRAHHYW